MRAPRPALTILSAVCACAALYACGGSSLPSSPSALTGTAAALPATDPAPSPANPVPPPLLPPMGGGTATLVGVGDISMCDLEGSGLTGRLMERLLGETHGTAVTFGDNSNDNGSRESFACFDRAWGSLKASLFPSPGNHDYEADPASPYYYEYFPNAGPSGLGYYSYDRGAWHIVSLNTELPDGSRQAQIEWLRRDLQQHPAECTLAYFHRPLFSSGAFGSPRARALWDTLYRAGV